jgi:hypothetical protein
MEQELRYTDWAVIDTQSMNVLRLNDLQAKM